MHSAFLPLEDMDLLLVEGPDARRFLQGQLTCDLNELSPTQSVDGALCNIQGRVIADFRLLDIDAGCYLQLPSGMASRVKSVLDKYMVFSKASSSVATDRFRLFGLIGNDAHRTVSNAFGDCPMSDGKVIAQGAHRVVKLPGLIPRFVLWISQASQATETAALLDELENTCSVATDTDWRVADIRAGIVHVDVDRSENYLPQQLNYDLSGVINFKKGCYTGQEIVARMYYRGTAKKRLYYLQVAGLKDASVTAVWHGAEPDHESHEVLSCQVDGDGTGHLLAILPVEQVAAAEDFYVAGNPDKLLHLQGLPYATLETETNSVT